MLTIIYMDGSLKNVYQWRFDNFVNFKTDNRSLKLATGLAKNPITHKEALHILSHYPHKDVRKAVAYHNNTHQDTLHKLSDPLNTWQVRRAVASHNNTHQDTLHKLSDDPDEYVRCGVAYHNNTHKDTLHKLSSDPDPSVRWE
jgi:hypothetical protein